MFTKQNQTVSLQICYVFKTKTNTLCLKNKTFTNMLCLQSKTKQKCLQTSYMYETKQNEKVYKHVMLTKQNVYYKYVMFTKQNKTVSLQTRYVFKTKTNTLCL